MVVVYSHCVLAAEPDGRAGQLLSDRTREVLRAVRATRYEPQPFVIDGSGRPEPVVNKYFSSRLFRGYAPGTREKYALAVRLWLNFCETRGASRSQAHPDDVADFKCLRGRRLK